jgi:hypothetical protein
MSSVEKFYQLSDVLSVAGPTAESLIPSQQSNASTNFLLRPFGTSPTALRLKDNKFFLSTSGHELGCDATWKVVSKFLKEEYNHIDGKENKRVQLLVDCGYTPENKRPTSSPQGFGYFLNNANKLSSLSITSQRGKLLADQYSAFSKTPSLKHVLPYIVSVVNRKPPSKLAEYTSRKFMLLFTL